MANDAKVKANKKNKGIVGFFKDLCAELKRFTWPTKAETKKSTIAVIIFCLLAVIVTGLLDKGFANLFNLVFFK